MVSLGVLGSGMLFSVGWVGDLRLYVLLLGASGLYALV